MALCTYSITLAWRGDKDRGQDMEKTITAAIRKLRLGEENKNKQAQKLCAALNSDLINDIDEDDYKFYNRQLNLLWPETDTNPEGVFAPVIEMFKDFEFFVFFVCDYCQKTMNEFYSYSVYANGKIVDFGNEKFTRNNKNGENSKAFKKALKAVVGQMDKWQSEKIIKKEQAMYNRDSDDGMTGLTIFVKDGTDALIKKFIDSFKKKTTSAQESFGDYRWKITGISSDKAELSGNTNDFWGIKQLIEETAADFPTLPIFFVAVYNNIEEECICGYSYKEIENGKVTSLAKEKEFETDDYDNDGEKTLNARNEALDETVDPIVSKWLLESQNGKPAPAAKKPVAKKPAVKKPAAPAEKKPKKGTNMKKKTRNFIYSDEKTNKYWSIEVSGKSYTVNYGKVGAPKGQSTTKEFDSEEACQKAAGKVIKEKTGKGYVEK